jgi:hypothetical protein
MSSCLLMLTSATWLTEKQDSESEKKFKDSRI